MTRSENPIPKEIPKPKDIFLPPNVALNILLVKHENKADLGDFMAFQTKIAGADIIIPEIVGWTIQTLELYRKVSLGDEEIYQATQKELESQKTDFPDVEYEQALLEAIYGSGKDVCLVDLKEGHVLIDEFDLFESTSDPYTDAEFKDHFHQEAEIIRSREDYILRVIGPALTEIIENKPELKGKERVVVLMIYGLNHKRLFDVLLKSTESQSGTSLPSVSLEQITDMMEDPYSELLVMYKDGIINEEKEEESLMMLMFGTTTGNPYSDPEIG